MNSPRDRTRCDLSTSAQIDVEDLGLDSVSPSSRLASRPMDTAAHEVTHAAETLLNLDALARHAMTVALHKSHGHKGRARHVTRCRPHADPHAAPL